MADDPTIVHVTGLQKRYKKHVAVNGVDLTITKGEIYGLIGPDGSGKSSVMKAIAGVLTYDSGSVEVFGTLVDSERAAERVKERIGFLPQGLGSTCILTSRSRKTSISLRASGWFLIKTWPNGKPDYWP